MNKILINIYRAVLEGDINAAQTEVTATVDAGITGGEILNTSLIPAMGEVGYLFEKEEYFVPEMLTATRAMQVGLEIVKALQVNSGLEPGGTVAMSTIRGDLHDIRKSLVAMMLEGAGFEIIDLATDVAAEKFVEAICSSDSCSLT
jgi:5-methyltetrahydrofolate--homocysteine methyltransferase